MQLIYTKCSLCAKSYARSKNEKFKEILNLLVISLEEDVFICITCMEKINKVYKFKKMCLNHQGSNDSEMKKDSAEYLKSCYMCKRPAKPNIVSFMTFLENNQMKKFFENHFPEISLSSKDNSFICKLCMDVMKDFMDIKLSLSKERPTVESPIQFQTPDRQLVVILNKMDLSKVSDVDIQSRKQVSKLNINGEDSRQNSHPSVVISSGLQYFCADCKIGGKCGHVFVRNHKDTIPGKFYCANCEYETTIKYLLKCHMRVHQTPFEIKMYKCPECSFRTKYKNSFNNHQILHKNRTEVKLYKCFICDFESIHRLSIREHVKVHKPKDQLVTYDCPDCDFKAKTLGNLKAHLISHQSLDSVKLYYCSKCDFKTRYKANFRRHLIVHKGPGEAEMIKCQFCDYQSKHLASVKKHLFCHDTGDVKIFACDKCQYETKHRNNYERHMLTHKKYGEVPMFKCPDCNYETNNKQQLKTHRYRQHDPNAKMYCCAQCDYKTTFKGNLTKHLIVHQDNKYKCSFCDFQTRHKVSLKQHLLIHKPEDAQMYDCLHCNYKTRHKQYLKRHNFLKHAVGPEKKDGFHLRKFKPPVNSELLKVL